MYPLRFSKLWLASAFALVALVIYGSLGTGGPVVPVSISDKVMHLGSYAVLMVWFGGMIKRRVQWFVLLVLFGVGVGLEFLQGLGGERVFEVADMVTNGIGLALGKAMCRVGLSGWCQVAERLVFRQLS